VGGRRVGVPASEGRDLLSRSNGGGRSRPRGPGLGVQMESKSTTSRKAGKTAVASGGELRDHLRQARDLTDLVLRLIYRFSARAGGGIGEDARGRRGGYPPVIWMIRECSACG